MGDTFQSSCIPQQITQDSETRPNPKPYKYAGLCAASVVAIPVANNRTIGITHIVFYLHMTLSTSLILLLLPPPFS
jgi:hypothetical protein